MKKISLFLVSVASVTVGLLVLDLQHMPLWRLCVGFVPILIGFLIVDRAL